RRADVIAAKHDGQRRLVREMLEALVLDELAQIDRYTLVVRQFETDPALAGDRRDDAHLARQAERQVVAQTCYATHLGSGFRSDLERRDGGAGMDLLDSSGNAVVEQSLFEASGLLEQPAAIDLGQSGWRRLEQIGRRKFEGRSWLALLLAA